MMKETEKGSAIMWILIAVGLFAALAFAFNSTNRTSTAVLTDEEAKSYANRIISYGNELKSAIKRMSLRGCDDIEYDFDNPDLVYGNPYSPTNRSCHVFDPKGGQLEWKMPAEGKITYPTNITFYAGGEIPGVGTTTGTSSSTELYYTLTFSNRAVCEAINELLGHTDLLPLTVLNPGATPGPTRFLGVYENPLTANVALSGKHAACHEGSTGIYSFYQVLISR